MKVQDEKEKKEFKAGFVAIVGRPSVGKSTFINQVCGEHTAITSPYPQTTRNIVRGIITRETFQIVLLDTPGIHYSENTYGKHLSQQASHALKDSDIILYMLDASRMPQKEEEHIVDILKNQDKSIFACVNKMDIEKPEIVLAHIQLLKDNFGEKLIDCHFISALDGTNIDHLLKDISLHLPQQEPYYPKEYYTDQSPEFRICEQVRAAALEFVKEELPHALYTEIIESNIKHRDSDGEATHLFVRVQIVVERPSQQGILIGKGGEMIKKIRILASKRLKNMFPYKVQLELRVAVKKKWRKNPQIFSKFSQ